MWEHQGPLRFLQVQGRGAPALRVGGWRSRVEDQSSLPGVAKRWNVENAGTLRTVGTLTPVGASNKCDHEGQLSGSVLGAG